MMRSMMMIRRRKDFNNLTLMTVNLMKKPTVKENKILSQGSEETSSTKIKPVFRRTKFRNT